MNHNNFKMEQRRILFFLIPFIFVYILTNYVLEVIVINGESMEPSYYHGDVVIALRTPISYEKDDVVVAELEGFHIIKRIAGTPGDIVFYAESIGDVKMPHTVSDNCYFLIGDNLPASHDSRFSDIGDIPKEKIIGKVIFKL